VGRTVAIVLALVLAVCIASCTNRVGQIREETLSDVELALTAAQELSQSVDADERITEGVSEVFPALERVAEILGDCSKRHDDCLAQSLTHLLEADRELLALAELNGEASDLAALIVPVRSAAERLYEHFYGEGSSSGGDEWRGPPTPRPPGVCPGG